MQTTVETKMIRIQTATSELELVKKLADKIKSDFKNKDLIFQPVHIISPNRAHFNWLKEQLAFELGLVANLEYHSLNSFFNKLSELLNPKSLELPSKEKLIWRLFTELGKELPSEFSKISNYCGNDEKKRLSLAQKLAGLFQDYQEYKPELISKWLNNENYYQNQEEEKWQAYLFKTADFAKQFISPEDFRDLVKKDNKVLEEFRSIYLFGDLSITPLQREYFKILSEFEELRIHVFQTNLELKAENNPLATNWGELAIEKLNYLNELGDFPEIQTPEFSGNTLLKEIQNDILNDKISDNLKKDDSILIYNSFTKVRELEALYNYLVKMVDEAKGNLGARDIAVYIPNLDEYIPAIKTVFDAAPYKFPYTLVSRGYSREEGFWTAIEQILNFEEDDFTAPKVFHLLEMEPIRKSFGFTDLDLLRKAFKEANIRREYKGDEELETNYASFSYGLQRLMYGFCLGNQSSVELNGENIWPVDIAEGQQAQDIFRLHHLVELLRELIEKKKKTKTATGWNADLLKIANDLLNPEQWQEKQFAILMENLVTLKDSNDEIKFSTFFHRLKDYLQTKDLQQVKGQGGIVFCGLYSGISQPKKVVAFLGLNFQEFPRRSQKLSFDLLEYGDKPESRKQDRAAFLQAFLNAEENVLLSYIGQNVKDNSGIPASSIISELKDYADKKGSKLKEVKHPLHAFNSAYFNPENNDLITYNAAKEARKPEKQVMEVAIPEEIQLYELENFLKDPFKHHYNKVLGIYYENPELLPEWECFDLDNLQEWKVKDSLKNARVEGEAVELEQFRKEMLLTSEIQLKNRGRVTLSETEARVSALWEKVEEIRNGRSIEYLEDSIHFDLTGGQKIKLKVKLEVIGKTGMFLIVSKKDKVKYELSAYIRFLVLRALGQNGGLHYFCLDGENPHHQEIYLNLTPEEALNKLKVFLEDFRQSYHRIIPFYPELNLKVEDLEASNEKEGSEKIEAIRELIDNRFEAWNSFFPSDYFLREYQQGFFRGSKGESNLLELQLRTIEITRGINDAFNQND